MDSELWASLLSATKRRIALQPYRLDRTLSHDDLEAHGDMQVEFNCPFCSGSFDIGSLCSHIEEEHCFEPKAAVCPVCSTKVKKDMRRRFRMAVTSVGSTFSSIVKERGVATLQVHASGNNYSHLGTDSLANILFGLQPSEGGEVCKPAATSLMDKECTTHQSNSSNFTTSEKSQRQLEAATLRASFVEQLVFSTIFTDA
ncbi:hypothetical protein GOP47_0020041 [Adiantum capillus-veneris]|uniref:Di19 zinc-binding domain-containing protein n=1 Tax=Adiantum capillus-veneris TaxID=13818 RepID=A0A9D4UC88_ADICA|nr:hypothetical protein GOP47_0020041 [Adiantum capillus-veneris]